MVGLRYLTSWHGWTTSSAFHAQHSPSILGTSRSNLAGKLSSSAIFVLDPPTHNSSYLLSRSSGTESTGIASACDKVASSHTVRSIAAVPRLDQPEAAPSQQRGAISRHPRILEPSGFSEMALSVSFTSFTSNSAATTRRSWQAAGHALPTGISSRVTLVPGLSCPSRATLPRRALVQAAVAAEAPTAIPSSAQTAKTIVELVGSGTLSTVDASGIPLGTYVTYVLGADGIPILRLRGSAVHTENLKANPNCSLFIHAPLQPIRSVARITLIGAVEEITPEEQAEAKEQHAVSSQYAIGVDAPSDDDIFMKLNVSRTFYVGGLGTECRAEEIDVAAYAAAEADGLAEFAPELVSYMNGERRMDVLRITGGAVEDITIDDVDDAELLWIDSLGVYIRAVVRNEERVVRANFMHAAIDERDAKSCLTMMAQLAWENERDYQPAPIPTSSDSN